MEKFKGINLYLKAVSVWQRELNISVSVNIGVLFQNYHYLNISTHLYTFVFAYVSTLIQYISLNNMFFSQNFQFFFKFLNFFLLHRQKHSKHLGTTNTSQYNLVFHHIYFRGVLVLI